MIKLIGFNPEEGRYQILECTSEKTYETIRNFIGNIIEPRDIIENEDGSYISMYVDEEGLLQDDPVPSVINCVQRTILYGNVVVAKTDHKGETVSLTEDEIKRILKNPIQQYLNFRRGTMTHVIALSREDDMYAPEPIKRPELPQE